MSVTQNENSHWWTSGLALQRSGMLCWYLLLDPVFREHQLIGILRQGWKLMFQFSF